MTFCFLAIAPSLYVNFYVSNNPARRTINVRNADEKDLSYTGSVLTLPVGRPRNTPHTISDPDKNSKFSYNSRGPFSHILPARIYPHDIYPNSDILPIRKADRFSFAYSPSVPASSDCRAASIAYSFEMGLRVFLPRISSIAAR